MDQAEIDDIIEYLQETERTLDKHDLDEEDKSCYWLNWET